MAVPLLIGVMTLLICWRVGAWADRIANRESRITDSDPLEGEGDGGVRPHPDAATIDPVDEHFSQTPVFGVPVHKTAESMQRWRDLVAPGLPDDAEAIVLDPEPSLREETIGQLHDRIPLGGSATVGGVVVSHPAGCPCGWPGCDKPAEVAPGTVKQGRNELHLLCVDAYVDRRNDDVCDLCRPALLGVHAAAPSEPTSGGSAL
jgi:hypothetical protein